MKPNVLLGVPAYGGQVHADFVHTLLGIEQARDHGLLDYSLITVTNESLITRARNSIISEFYNNLQFTHLCFIDADIGFTTPRTLPAMLQRDKDVIGLPVPLKGYDEQGNHVLNIGKILSEPDENGVVEVEHVGNAVFMLSRNAAKSLCDNSHTYNPSGLTRGYKSRSMQYDVFQVGVRNGIYLSEDYYICSRLRGMGYSIYLQTGISVKHNGNYTFIQ